MMLPVQWQGQPDETWCWATSASIISVYYAQMGAGQAFSACEVAGRTLGTLCCAPVPTDPPPPECQTSFDLERALDAVGHLNPNALPADGFALVQEEINNNRPLCAMIKFNGGPFHYIVLNGFDTASQQVMVVDPASTSFPMPFQAFLVNAHFSFVDWILTA